MSLLIHNALIVTGEDPQPYIGWMLTDGTFITDIGRGVPAREIYDRAEEVIDAHGNMLIPGVIDCHVHFREPGMTRKATIESESRAALAGGVTSFIDMPNTKPATTTIDTWQDKMNRAAQSSAINYSFMIGATADNLQILQNADYTKIPAVKVFMGSSTGNMLIDDTTALEMVFSQQPGMVVVHAEDQDTIDRRTKANPDIDPNDIANHAFLRNEECCVIATAKAVALAKKYGTRLHIAHITTAKELEFLTPGDSPTGKQITAEVSPSHLLFDTDDYKRLGTRIKMNPAIKTTIDRAALRQALSDGRIDIVATDHAPHLADEKKGTIFTAVSGAPMVQFSLVKTLDIFNDPELVVRRMCNGPALLYGIDRRGFLRKGYYADFAIVERLTTPATITDKDVKSLCGWTPLNGATTGHRVIMARVGGSPRPLTFNR